MELFAYKVKFDKNNNVDLSANGAYPDANFNKFYNAFLTVFVVLTGDTWSDIFYHHYRAVDPYTSTAFFMTLIGLG